MSETKTPETAAAPEIRKKVFLVCPTVLQFSGEVFPIPNGRASEEELAEAWKDRLEAVNESMQAQKQTSGSAPAPVTVRDLMNYALGLPVRPGSDPVHVDIEYSTKVTNKKGEDHWVRCEVSASVGKRDTVVTLLEPVPGNEDEKPEEKPKGGSKSKKSKEGSESGEEEKGEGQ